jgi:hypothetical protein
MPTISFKFDSVRVIQSLRPSDHSRIFEDSVLPESTFAGLEADRVVVNSHSELLGYLAELVRWVRDGAHSPILHFDCHGTRDGVYAGADLVRWADLKPSFIELNVLSRLNLLVCLGACNGGHLVQAVTPNDRAPVWAIVGPTDEPSGHAVNAAFGRFYEILLRERDGAKALNSLHEAIHADRRVFAFVPAEWFFEEVWRGYESTQNSPEEIKNRARGIAMRVRDDKSDLTTPLETLQNTFEILLGDERQKEKTFIDYRDRFFMRDLYAENRERFRFRSRTF